MVGTFILVTIGFIIFRADNINQAWNYFSAMVDLSDPSFDEFSRSGFGDAIAPITFALVLFVTEWVYRDSEHPLTQIGLKWKTPLRFAMYYAIIIAIFWFGGKEQQFIYFQF